MMDCSQSSFIREPLGAGLWVNPSPQGRNLIFSKKDFLLLNEERCLWPFTCMGLWWEAGPMGIYHLAVWSLS